MVDSLPTKTSGKVDRHALPWPLAGAGAADTEAAPLNLPDDAAWIVEQWSAVLGSTVSSLDADFFAYGGGSLAAAQLVSALRVRYPTITVADIYATPRVGALIDAARQSLPEGGAGPAPERTVRRTARRSQVFQTLMGVPLHILVGHALADVPDGGEQSARPPSPASRRRPRCPGGGWAPPGSSSSALRAGC